MTASNFFSLPTKEKKKILRSVVRGANEDQMKVMEQYEALNLKKVKKMRGKLKGMDTSNIREKVDREI